MTSLQPQPPEPQPPVVQDPHPVVVVVNQQPTEDPVQGKVISSRPYLNRGAKFCNGCHCSFQSMKKMIHAGTYCLVFGIIFFFVYGAPSFIFIVIGGVLLAIAICLVYIAKKQFDSLPPDHPDRTKYTAQRNIPDSERYQTPTTYAMPPMQNQATSYPPTTAGQNYLVLDSETMTQLIPQPGGKSPHDTYQPEDDSLATDSDVVRNK